MLKIMSISYQWLYTVLYKTNIMIMRSRYKCPLDYTNIIFSNTSSESPHLSGLNTYPPMLKSLSTVADDAGKDRCLAAILAKCGYLDSLLLQKHSWCFS